MRDLWQREKDEDGRTSDYNRHHLQLQVAKTGSSRGINTPDPLVSRTEQGHVPVETKLRIVRRWSEAPGPLPKEGKRRFDYTSFPPLFLGRVDQNGSHDKVSAWMNTAFPRANFERRVKFIEKLEGSDYRTHNLAPILPEFNRSEVG